MRVDRRVLLKIDPSQAKHMHAERGPPRVRDPIHSISVSARACSVVHAPALLLLKNMHIDTTMLPMDDSLDLGPKPSAGPKLSGFRCCCLPSQKPHPSSRHHSSGKKIPSTTRTTPSTDDDGNDDDDDEIPQFFIDADGIPQDDVKDEDGTNDAFWKKFMSILWLLLAAQYWTGATRTGVGAESDGEKSLPPEVNVEDDCLDVSLDGEDEAEEER